MRIRKWSKDGTQITFPVTRRRNDARGQYPKLPLRQNITTPLLVSQGHTSKNLSFESKRSLGMGEGVTTPSLQGLHPPPPVLRWFRFVLSSRDWDQ